MSEAAHTGRDRLGHTTAWLAELLAASDTWTWDDGSRTEFQGVLDEVEAALEGPDHGRLYRAYLRLVKLADLLDPTGERFPGRAAPVPAPTVEFPHQRTSELVHRLAGMNARTSAIRPEAENEPADPR